MVLTVSAWKKYSGSISETQTNSWGKVIWHPRD